MYFLTPSIRKLLWPLVNIQKHLTSLEIVHRISGGTHFLIDPRNCPFMKTFIEEYCFAYKLIRYERTHKERKSARNKRRFVADISESWDGHCEVPVERIIFDQMPSGIYCTRSGGPRRAAEESRSSKVRASKWSHPSRCGVSPASIFQRQTRHLLNIGEDVAWCSLKGLQGGVLLRINLQQ